MWIPEYPGEAIDKRPDMTRAAVKLLTDYAGETEGSTLLLSHAEASQLVSDGKAEWVEGREDAMASLIRERAVKL